MSSVFRTFSNRLCEVIFVRSLSILILLMGLGISPAFGQNILIFSTSHSNTKATTVTNPTGVLKLQISAFNPILEIQVNGEIQPRQNETSAILEYPYQLSAGDNQIAVVVNTATERLTKSFSLYLGETKKKQLFQLITVGKVEQTDNATSVKEEKEADTKIGVTVIPRYKMALDKGTDLLFQGILLREKYSNSELASPQVEYMDLSASYLSKAGFGNWQVDVGYSDIGSTTAADATRAEIEKGTYVGGSVRLNALDNKNVKLGARYTLKDEPDPATEAHDGDGGALALNVSWDKKLNPIKLQVSAGYVLNDAKGMYGDYSVLNLGAKGDYPLDKKITLTGQLKVKQTTYAESDPLKGDTEASSLTTVSAKGSYKLPIKGLIGLAAVTQKTQSSNITGKEYATLLIGLSVIYVFQ